MKILFVDSEWDGPDLKVHRVNSKFDADAVVKLYKSDYDVIGSMVEDDTLKWVLVESSYEDHDRKIMWVDSAYDADIKVLFTSSDLDTKWVDESKREVMLKKSTGTTESQK